VNVSSLCSCVCEWVGACRVVEGRMCEECHQIRDRWHANALNVKYLCFTWEERNLEIDTSIESWKILDKLTVFNQKITTRDVTQMIVKWRFQRASNRSRGRSGRGGSRQNTRRDSRLNRGIEENPRMKIDDRSRFNSEGGRRCRIEGTRASGDGVN
jgi:hypothetical protein